jgi:nucleoside-diphosphate-sugar epimerase
LKKKILIVGGSGFIGYHLAKGCLKKKWNVVSISTHKPKKKRYLKKVKYIICDISEKKILKKKIKEKFNYVVNLGGHVDHSNSKKTFLSHYIGLKNLAEIFQLKKPELFLQIGSGGEYGKSKSPHTEENENKLGKSVYYKSKFLASEHLVSLFRKKNFPSTILRLYQIYGPRQDKNRIVPIAIDNCLKNKIFNCSSGLQWRDFLYVQDLVNCIFKVFRYKNRVKGEIINIGSGKTMQVKKIISLVREKIGKGRPLFGKIKMREDEILKVYPSIKKANKILNWKPSTHLSRGLQFTINDYENLRGLK